MAAAYARPCARTYATRRLGGTRGCACAFGDRIGRARARAVLGDRRQPAAGETVVRAGQPRHRGGRRVRADRRDGFSPRWWRSPATTRSTWSCPGRRRRWSPASPMRWRRPASPAAARAMAAAQLEGSKTFTKEICRRRRHPDREVGAVRGRRGRARIRPPPRRADRGQGRRPRRRQGRRGRRDRGRGAGRDRSDHGTAARSAKRAPPW